MAERINLAQFDIDTRLIEDKIASNMQKINALRTSITDVKATIKEYQTQTTESTKKIADNTKQQEDAETAYNGGLLTQEAYNDIIAQTSLAIRQEELSIARLVQEERQQLTTLNSLQNEAAQYTAENRTLNRALRDGITELDQMNRQMDEVDQASEQLTEQTEEERTAFERLKDQLSDTRKRANDLAAEMLELEEAGDTTSDTYEELRRTWEQASQEALELHQQVEQINRSTRRQQNQDVSPYDQLKKDLADAREEAYDLGAEMMRLRRAGDTTSEEYRNVRAAWISSSESARLLHDQILELETATNDYRRNVGNYANGIRDAFSDVGTGFAQIMSGNVIQGFETLKESFGDIKKAAKDLWIELMANPLLALAAAITAIGVGLYQGGKAVFEYNKEVAKLNKEVEQLTNQSGKVVDSIREKATALSTVFGKEFKDGVGEVNSLMKDFGLTSDQAFKLYTEGLAKGGAANGEFGDSIKEYGVLFAQNGYSAEQFLNLLNAGIDLDVYTDKLPDAIKESGLALNEQTKATRDALINAFGQPFSDDLLKRIRSGNITVKQGLDEIALMAQKVGLNTQQIAQLNADVFKGAGEDAGGLVKIIEAINLANDANAQKLTKSQQAVVDLAIANEKMEEAKTKAFKSDSINSFSSAVSMATIAAETGFYKVVESLRKGVEWFDRVTGASEVVNETFEAGKKYIKAVWEDFKALGGVLNDLSDALGLSNSGSESILKTVLKTINPLNLIKLAYQALTTGIKVFTGIVESSRVNITTFALTAKSLLSQIIDVAGALKNMDFAGALDKIKNFSITGELKKARAEAEKIVALNRQAKQDSKEDVAQDPTKIKGNKDLTGAAADAAAKAEKERQKLLEKQRKEEEAARKKAQTALDKAAKEDLANAKERANIAVQATQAELAEYIAMNAEKLKSDKRLTQERVNQIKEYLEKVREQTQIANDQEKQIKLKSLDEQIAAIKGASQQDLDNKKNLVAQKAVIEKEYSAKEIQINNEANEKKQEVDKSFLDQKREMQNLATALAYEKKLQDLEKEGATVYELQKAQLNKEMDQRLSAFIEENELKRQLDQENYDLNAEIIAQRQEIENQLALEQDEAKKLRLQNLLAALNIISQDYASKDVKIAQEKEMAKWSLASSIAMGMAKIAGEQTKAGKAMAIAGATIDTIAGSIRALKDYPAPYSYILMGTTIAAGLAQVAKIAGVNTGGAESAIGGISSAISSYAPKKEKAANGMLIGPSHDNGGIPIKVPGGMIEAEGGEVIINKKSSAMYRDVLSQINQMGGGVKFASGGIVPGVSTSKLPTVQNIFKQQQSITLDQSALNDIYNAIYSGGSDGIVKLSENREIRRGANF